MYHAREDVDRIASGRAVALALALAGCLTMIGCGPAEPPRRASQPAPATASAGGWLPQVRAQIAAGEYRVRDDGGTLRAWNRSQRLAASWSADGLALRPRAARQGAPAIGLRSVAFGPLAAPAPLAARPFQIGGCRADGARDEAGQCLRRVERDTGALLEWWENTPAGLEQGFDLRRPPGRTAGGWVSIDLQVTGGRAELAPDGSEAILAAADGALYRYGGLAARDAGGRALPARMRPASRGLSLQVDDSGARYPIRIDPMLTASSWVAESNQAGGGDGMTVAGAGDVNGDGLDDLLVAFPSYDGGGAGAGRVFLYLGSGIGPEPTPAWSSQGTNAAGQATAIAGSRFGSSVASAGDVDGDGIGDVLVGQSGFSNPQVGEGRAYLFLGSADGLRTSPAWVVESDLAGAALGVVGGAGDIDGDGFDDVLVGAPATTGAGRVMVFRGGVNGLLSTPSDTLVGGAGQHFGSAVASAGDINGDGRDDVLVAAGTYTAAETEEGAAFAYLGRADGTLDRAGAFNLGTADHIETNEAGAQVTAVAGLGDINGDGFADVAVGSAGKDDAGGGSVIDQGAVYVFTGSASGLAATPRIIAGNQVGARFGAAVAGPGDVNGDGFADIAVGAPGWDDAARSNAGAVIVIAGSATGPVPAGAAQAETVLVGAASDEALGSAVGAAGDINNDGYADVIAAAPGASRGQDGEGRATLLAGVSVTTGLRRGSDLTFDGSIAAGGVGVSMAGAGDINGDGYSDIAVAIPNAEGANNGRVLLYLGGPGGPDATADGTLTGPAGAEFGKSMAHAGDVNGDGFGDLLIGAPGFSGGQGRIYLYPGSAGGITAATTPVTFDSGIAGARLGAAVGSGDIDGDGLSDVLAGAPGFGNVGELNEGRVYLLRGSLAGLVTSNPITVESNVAGARFGAAVAGAGDMNGDGRGDVIVGAPGFSGGAVNEGRVYLYHGTATGLGPPVTTEGEGGDNAAFGASVDTAGDADHDGFADVVIGAPGANNGDGLVYVYEGTASGLLNPPFSYASPNIRGAAIGASVAGVGDLDRDGIADVVAGAPSYSNGEDGEGALYVFLSGNTILPGAVSLILEGGAPGLHLGAGVAGAGDVNGDGVSDVLVGAPGFGASGQGRVLLHLGNTAGRPYHLRALRPGSAVIIQEGSVVPASVNAFDISILASAPAGVSRVRLETEVKPLGVLFNDDDTVVEPTYTSTGLAGVTLTRHVTGLNPSTAYHYRARLRYDPAQRALGPRQSPWIQGSQNEIFGVNLRTDAVAGGTSCTSTAQCGAGFCVDGVCCTTECGGGVTSDCLACSAAAGSTKPDGICGPRAAGAGCNDKSACTGTDVCQASGVCAGAPIVTCSASDSCHDLGVCNPQTGVCSNPPKMDGTLCSTTDMCTSGTVCQAGACTGGHPRDCNDDNPCTTDSCTPATGCSHLAMAGCVPPPDAGAPADGPAADGSSPPPDGAAPPDGVQPDGAPAPSDGPAADGPLAADARPATDGAGRDSRDAGSDATKINRAGGGGGCDCDVGHGPRRSGGMQASLLAAAALALFRRRRRSTRG